MAEPDSTPITGAVRSFLTAPFSRRTWTEIAYLLITMVLSASGCCIVLGLLLFGLLFSPFLIGVPLLALAVLVARHVSATVHRALAASLVGEHVPEPPERPQYRRGFLGWLGWSLGDGPGWRAIAFLLLSAMVTGVGGYTVIVASAAALILASYPLWWQVFDPVNVSADGVRHHSGMQFGDYYIETWPRALMVAAIGLVMLFALPWFVRGFVWVDRLLVRNLLGPWGAAARIRSLEESRAQVVDDSAATLRRIERDLHDGTQARLVALAMQLDMAREELVTEEPTESQEAAVRRARELVETAHRNATEAITELREVTRSIHPPILDRGLDAALATLAAGSAVPTLLHTDIRSRPSAAIETIAYFCVAELLANVAKHSQARQASVSVVSQDDGRLRIWVRDDGVGGARITESRGLAGLSDRLRAVDGRLTIDSPAGGPTVVAVDLPTTS